MRRILGTIFLLAFLGGVLISGIGCGGKKAADDQAFRDTKVPTGKEREAQMDEVLGEDK